MHHSTVKKVLADEHTLDVATTAEAVLEDKRIRAKKDKPTNPLKALKAHSDWLARQQAKEIWRLKLKDVWNKHKKK